MSGPAPDENPDWGIIESLVESRGVGMTREMAELVLSIQPEAWESALMSELTAKAREGSLTEREREEAEYWARREHILSIAQARARRWLKASQG